MFTLTLFKTLHRRGLMAAICMKPFATNAEEFQVMMLNAATGDASKVRHLEATGAAFRGLLEDLRTRSQ